ncbi:MAG TPA: thiamine pyrophosphate-binding protein [Candidatus Tectomicrobia bacterium]|nr:thiamine pyrophosphate-binding protein [Candidatus Tectomicrobia bacterium]
MAEISGKHALAELLHQEGVEYVFGNPGTTELPLMDVLAQRDDLRYILSLHEGVALAMAAGYAEASGKIGVTNFHVAPGLGNALGLIYTAHMSRTPLLVTAGQQDRRMQLEEPLLWGDLVQMARPYTKWAYEISGPVDLPRAVRRALKVAMTPPTGPVFLSLPMDVLEESADVDLAPTSRPDLRPGPLPELLVQAAEVLCAAQNPTIIVGDRVSKSGALAEAVTLAETLGARVYGEPQANSVAFPADHPLFAGVLPSPSQGIRRALEPADVVLVIGLNLFQPFLYTDRSPLPDHVTVVQIDSDPWEVGKNYPVKVGVLSDPKAAMAQLSPLLRQRLTPTQQDTATRRLASERELRLQERRSLESRTAEDEAKEPMSALILMRELSRALPADAVVVNESVTAGGTLRAWLQLKDERSFFQAKGGGLGFGLPGVVGVKLALPERPVVGLIGEGSAMYAIQGLWTAAHYDLPVVFVICNNAQYRILKSGLLAFRSEPAKQGKFVGMDLVHPEIDFVRMAESLGVAAERVTRPQDVGPALRQALSRSGPSLLDIPIDRSVRALF